MAARRTRAAARRAALVPFLSELSDDEIEAIGYALADPLAPRLAIALSSCSRGLRRALEAPLRELKKRRQKVLELCLRVGTSCSELQGATNLGWRGKALSAAHMHTGSSHHLQITAGHLARPHA